MARTRRKIPRNTSGPPTASGPGPAVRRIVPAALAAGLMAVYLLGLHPGVAEGDSAELQWACSVLGVCHSPGYEIETLVGEAFIALVPLRTPAWRVNLLMAVCGVIGCLALYGAVRRITGRMAAGVVAATTLGFTSVYWSHCLVAECYVFYGMFLLLGVYAAARFVESDAVRWCALTALFLGLSIADRPSEIFVLPAFLGMWICFRKQARLRPGRLAAAVGLMVLPFVFSLAC